VQYCLFT